MMHGTYDFKLKDVEFVCDRTTMKSDLYKKLFQLYFGFHWSGFLEHHVSYFIHMRHERCKFICDQSTIKGNLLQEKKSTFRVISACVRGSNFAVSTHVVELRNLVAIGR